MSNVIDFIQWKKDRRQATIDEYNRVSTEMGFMTLEDQEEVFGFHYPHAVWERAALEVMRTLYDDTLLTKEFKECCRCGNKLKLEKERDNGLCLHCEDD